MYSGLYYVCGTGYKNRHLWPPPNTGSPRFGDSLSNLTNLIGVARGLDSCCVAEKKDCCLWGRDCTELGFLQLMFFLTTICPISSIDLIEGTPISAEMVFRGTRIISLALILERKNTAASIVICQFSRFT